jgi:hypothetical protein
MSELVAPATLLDYRRSLSSMFPAAQGSMLGGSVSSGAKGQDPQTPYPLSRSSAPSAVSTLEWLKKMRDTAKTHWTGG